MKKQKEIKYENRKCKFCNQKFIAKKGGNQKFCSQICMQDWNRMNIYKKFGRGPSYQYICRALTIGNKTGDAFGITIPKEIVDKYDLYHKKFKIDIKETGWFLIKTKIEYTEIK